MAGRIMVIDDTPEMLEVYQDLLTDEGYEVVVYQQPLADASEAERENPDLIILDWVFGRDRLGLQAYQQLKDYLPTRDIPVLICTAATVEIQQDEVYLRTQGADILNKPFDVNELLERVKQTLLSHANKAS